jgi:hypothetical protein|uniref:Uncharacterized protein n=2 Tax=Leptospirillum TaxID=179 RepID=C6HUR8_9BACT|nr:MAG: Hypothetical protein CGL2_11216013a [Leptospirillum sp. Group II '5-way CG']EES53694.1 MAG: hypothetical protein UBAL3_69480061 [Leptospirillum ferrodiazotrophum]
MNIHEADLDKFEKLVKLPEMQAPEDLQEVYRAADGIMAVSFILLSPIPEAPFSPVIQEGLANAALCLSKKILDDLVHMKEFPRRG